ncbi:MAG: Imm49 family immunity protein [Gemmatimonadaceae bacterium]
MSLVAQLKDERDNADALIEAYAAEVIGTRNRDAYEFALAGLTSFLRTRAVARFLIDADVGGFRLDLVRSARCQLFYYCHIQMDMEYNTSIAAITNDGPFFDALAAGSERDAYLLSYYQTAVALPEDLESPRYPYNMFLRSKVCQNVPRRPSYKDARVDEWLAGDERSDGARVAVARAMERGDSKAFHDAMKAFLAESRQLPETTNVSTTDQLLSIEGLGLCWLAAAKCGIRVDVDDPLVPMEVLGRSDPLPVPDDVPILTAEELEELETKMADLYGLSVDEFRRRRPDPRV